MKDKLLSILKQRKDKKGFTLIELLVVIAIIAILVVIVVVAINPVQRLRDASDRTAASNTRSAGTLISVCITQSLVDGTTKTLLDCDDIGKIEAQGDGNWPGNTTYADNEPLAVAPTNICAIEEGSAGTFWSYQSMTGEVDDQASSLTDCT